MNGSGKRVKSNNHMGNMADKNLGELVECKVEAISCLKGYLHTSN